MEFAGRDQTTLPHKLLQNSVHAQNCLKRPCGRKSQERYQHKLECRSRNASVLWQSGTRKCLERYQHKLEYRSRNTSVLWQSGTRKCLERYQHKVEYRSRNTSVLWQTGTATPFGTYNFIPCAAHKPPHQKERKHQAVVNASSWVLRQ